MYVGAYDQKHGQCPTNAQQDMHGKVQVGVPENRFEHPGYSNTAGTRRTSRGWYECRVPNSVVTNMIEVGPRARDTVLHWAENAEDADHILAEEAETVA